MFLVVIADIYLLDEPYLAFERGIQDGLTALLNHIRNHLLQKEGQLREYQVINVIKVKFVFNFHPCYDS